MVLEWAAVSGVRNFIPPFVDVLADRLPHANSYDGKTPSSARPALAGRRNATDTDELRQIVEFTLDREMFAADVIQRLSYRIDYNSELSRRARSYAVELRHYIARLKALLPSDVCPVSDDRPLRGKPKRTIESLESDEARLVLLNFLRSHADGTRWVLSAGGDQARSRAVEMLRRRVDRERHKIALWIGEQEATLRGSPDWRTRRV